jgi:hypothetical protein
VLCFWIERIPVKELEDYPWFPAALRNFQTEYIGFAVVLFGMYDAFVRHLLVARLRSRSMTDLCSGSGQPAISIFKKSHAFRCLLLSDKYAPGKTIKDENITYDRQSRDVLTMDFKSGTCYTMFNAFHHFGDEDKRKIVQRLRASGSDAFVAELLTPTVWCLLKVVFASTVGVLGFTPFVRPFSFPRLFFTYLLPVNVLTIAFDGIVSVIKSRAVEQYRTLFEDCDGVKIFKLKGRFGSLIILQIEGAE